LPDISGIDVRRDQVCPLGDGGSLAFDVYLPPRRGAEGAPPVVLFVHGDASPDMLRDVKDIPQYTGWGQLLAASGLAAVTFNRRSTENFSRIAEAEAEVTAMLEHLAGSAAEYGFDATRVGVCAFSGGPPTVIPRLLREQPPSVRCLVVFYGLLDLQQPGPGDGSPAQPLPAAFERYSATATSRDLPDVLGVPPMLVLRAGRDLPVINDNLTRFVATALERGVAVELFNHPEGEHGFEVHNDTPRTREAVVRTVEFLRWHLAA
jgi:acetyl esterase/lipase